MNKNPIYHFYTVPEKNIVVCVTRFAGKPVRGVAKCSPKDNFDPSIGMHLAQARCDIKVERMRLKFAEARRKAAISEYDAAMRNVAKASDYVADASTAFVKACECLTALEKEFAD